MTECTSADLAREFGFKDAAGARSWIKRVGLKSIGRDFETDAKKYDLDEARRARQGMPGRWPQSRPLPEETVTALRELSRRALNEPRRSSPSGKQLNWYLYLLHDAGFRLEVCAAALGVSRERIHQRIKIATEVPGVPEVPPRKDMA